MLTDGGVVKILDFGLARRLPVEEAEFDPGKTAPRPGGPKQTYTARGGTIAYMAPEQFVTGQSSVQSDLSALGIILYELVSGRHPFVRPDGGRVPEHAGDSVCRSDFVRRVLPEVPAGIGECDLTCLAKDSAGALFVGRGCTRGAEDHHEDDADRDWDHSW